MYSKINMWVIVVLPDCKSGLSLFYLSEITNFQKKDNFFRPVLQKNPSSLVLSLLHYHATGPKFDCGLGKVYSAFHLFEIYKWVPPFLGTKHWGYHLGGPPDRDIFYIASQSPLSRKQDLTLQTRFVKCGHPRYC